MKSHSIKPHDPKRSLEAALQWLRDRNRYVLDTGSFRPSWGIPGTVPASQPRGIWQDRK